MQGGEGRGVSIAAVVVEVEVEVMVTRGVSMAAVAVEVEVTVTVGTGTGTRSSSVSTGRSRTASLQAALCSGELGWSGRSEVGEAVAAGVEGAGRMYRVRVVSLGQQSKKLGGQEHLFCIRSASTVGAVGSGTGGFDGGK